MTALLVLAKAPRAGRSKTRLSPAVGSHGAARLAGAALQDTLDAGAAAHPRRRVLVLDGDLRTAPDPVHVPSSFEIVRQAPGGHAARIAAALADCTEPAVLIGMDTPQVTPGLLDLAIDRCTATDAVLGLAPDGGWWVLGLRDPARWARAALAGVPMSTPWTGAAQWTRLDTLGLAVTALPALRDVDTPADAAAVAGQAPETHFARLLDNLLPRAEPALSTAPRTGTSFWPKGARARGMQGARGGVGRG